MSDPWRTWMPLDIGKYLKDTGRLTTLEHGAYFLLIMDYWTHGSLPQDDATLSSIAKLTVKQWLAIKPKVSAFFRPDWTHKKIEAELAEAEAKYTRRAKAGRTGGIQKAENELAKAEQEPSIASSNAIPIATHNKQVTPSDEGTWVNVRERVSAAFVAANNPNPPDTSWVEIWKQRGHNPEICLAVVRQQLASKTNIFSLKFFDQAIADAHIAPMPQARDGPRRSASHDGRHDVLAELRAAKDGKRDHQDEAGRPAGEPNRSAVPRLERVP